MCTHSNLYRPECNAATKHGVLTGAADIVPMHQSVIASAECMCFSGVCQMHSGIYMLRERSRMQCVIIQHIAPK